MVSELSLPNTRVCQQAGFSDDWCHCLEHHTFSSTKNPHGGRKRLVTDSGLVPLHDAMSLTFFFLCCFFNA
jgi:hypothetical protein